MNKIDVCVLGIGFFIGIIWTYASILHYGLTDGILALGIIGLIFSLMVQFIIPNDEKEFRKGCSK